MVNLKESTLQEHWTFATVNRIAFNSAEGMSIDWDATITLFGVRLKSQRGAGSVFVFTGVPHVF